MREFKRIINESDGAIIYEKLAELVSLGDRYAGSEADNSAAIFMEKEFKKSNFDVINEEFEANVFEEFESYIKLDNHKFESRAMSYSMPTEEIKKEAIIVGYGEEEDYKEIDVKDKIVIALRKGTKDNYWEDVSRASKNGASGFVLINNHPWITITTLETGYFDPKQRLIPIEPNPIPAMVLGQDEGEELISLIKAGKVNTEFKIDAFNGKRKVTNVRAIKKGVEKPKEKIVIYGHRDTVGTPGANDNGSGTVVMLEIARVLKNIELAKTVELISLSAEEHLGSEGSIAYLKRHKDSLNQIQASIELDMIGAGSKINVMNGGRWQDKDVYFSELLTDYIIDVARHMGYFFEKDFSDMGTPDSGRFAEMGVETTWIWCPDDVHYHSSEDSLENVDINKLKIISDVVLTAIYDLANS